MHIAFIILKNPVFLALLGMFFDIYSMDIKK